jgi:hypothetical protein
MGTRRSQLDRPHRIPVRSRGGRGGVGRGCAAGENEVEGEGEGEVEGGRGWAAGGERG